MNAITLSIGNELVLGQTIDTNSAWLSQRLAAIGIDCISHITVGDDQSAIASAITNAASQCDLLLVTGGLGPTKDDLTRQALSDAIGQPLEMNAAWLERMEALFRRLNRIMVDSNRAQALLPRGAKMIENTAGTACGIAADFPADLTRRPCKIFVMPGVPVEMRTMFDKSIQPHLAEKGGGNTILTHTLHTFGVGESTLGEMLGDLMNRDRNPLVGTTVSGGVVSIRITSRQSSPALAHKTLADTLSKCRDALGDLIFGENDQTLPMVIASLLSTPTLRKISTAESCTGGLLAKMLTDVPGSSHFFHRGWVTYSDDSKTDLLGVPSDLIANHGAVSEPVVAAMAAGARQNSRSDFSLALSGIAGPGGGSPEKPVGTVCIALAHPTGQVVRTFRFPGDREMVRDRSAKMALTLLRYQLHGRTFPY